MLFLTYSILDFFSASEESFDSVPTAISAILIIGFCIIYLFEKLKNPDTLFLYRTPDFWIVVGLIIYFSGTFFVYIFSRNYFNNPEFERVFIIINTAFTTFRNLIFAAAILIKPEKEIFKFSLK